MLNQQKDHQKYILTFFFTLEVQKKNLHCNWEENNHFPKLLRNTFFKKNLHNDSHFIFPVTFVSAILDLTVTFTLTLTPHQS